MNKFVKNASLVLVVTFVAGFFSEAFARSGPRIPRYVGRSGAVCRNLAVPPECPGVRSKGGSVKVVSQICQALKKNPRCFVTNSYRTCRDTGRIRGAARNSAHRCGKAADIRLGTCGLGQVHRAGTAPHRHFQVGRCL